VKKSEPLALLMIDLDNFKQINDQYGHAAGDDCLRAVAQTLERQVHSSAGSIARYGGEEFAAVLPNSGLAQAHLLAESMRGDVARHPVATEQAEVHPTISIGICAVPAGAPLRANELLKHADAALYAAKRGGRNRVEVAALD
jgi:diguanylate cyclase (GGDEF)-like protein